MRRSLQEYFGDESAAARAAAGCDGDRYQVLGHKGGAGADALVWYTLWDDKAAAARFTHALQRAWGKRRSGGSMVRRWEIKPLLVSAVRVVRLVDAPAGWAGWKRVPGVRCARAAL